MVDKAPDAFRTISEAAEELDLPQHVLRHWEEVFGQVRPMRRAGGRRYYRTQDIELLNGVRTLLYDERYTTKGVQKIFRENGSQYIAEIGRGALASDSAEVTTPAFATDGDVAAQDEVTEESANQSLLVELKDLLARLETVQDSLDEAILSIDTITVLEDK